MGWVDLALTVLKFAIDLWSNRSNPEMAKAKAAALITRELNNDLESFDKAIKDNDPKVISEHFEQLRDRVAKLTGGANLNE